MKRKVSNITFLGFITLFAFLYSCDNKKIYGPKQKLEYLYNKGNIEGDSEKRLINAISKWDNGVVEKVPELICASLHSIVGKDKYYLVLLFSDEDANVAGFGIREQSVSQEKPSVDEIYPIFVKPPSAVYRPLVPVNLRTMGERKDESAWNDYINNPMKLEEPPVWITVPKKNNIEVEVFIYDSDGNISNSVSVQSFLAA